MSDTWRPLAFGYDPQDAPEVAECPECGEYVTECNCDEEEEENL